MPSVRVSRKAVSYALGGAVLLVLAAGLNRPSLAILGAVPILLVVLQARGLRLRNVQVQHGFDKEAVRSEGMQTDVELTVTSGSRRRNLIEVRDRLPRFLEVTEGSNHRLLSIRKGAPFTMKYSVRSDLFGIHQVGPLDVRIEDPFGFYSLSAEYGTVEGMRYDPRAPDIDASVVRSVLPQPFMGQYEVSQPGSGFDFFGLRDYNRADRMRDVNWKATARAGRLVVNQHVRESRADVVLLLCCRATEATGHPLRSPWAQAGRVAAEVGQELVRRKDTLRVALYGERLREERRTGTGRQVRALYDLLVETQPNGWFTLEAAVDELLPTLSPKSPVLIFSSLLGDATAHKAVLRLVSQGNFVVLLTARPGREAEAASPLDAIMEADRESQVQRIRGYGAIVIELDALVPSGVAA